MASIKGLWYTEAQEGQGHKQRGGGGEATGGDTGSETSAHPGEPRPVETASLLGHSGEGTADGARSGGLGTPPGPPASQNTPQGQQSELEK